VQRPHPRSAYRVQRVSVPAADRPVLYAAGLGAAAAFAQFGPWHRFPGRPAARAIACTARPRTDVLGFSDLLLAAVAAVSRQRLGGHGPARP